MSEYLSEEEQLERLSNWWKENGTALIVGVVVVLGAFVGWRFYSSHQAEQAAAASDLYASYTEADSADGRALLLAELEAAAPGSTYHAFALFDRAAELVEGGELEPAAQMLQTVLDDPSDRLIEDLARLRNAAVLQGLDRSDEALGLLQGISSEGYRRSALELKGDIHQARGEWEAAHDAYTQALAASEEGAQTQLLKLKAINTQGVATAEVAVEPEVVEAEALMTEEAAEEVAEEAAQEDADDAPDEPAADDGAAEAAEEPSP